MSNQIFHDGRAVLLAGDCLERLKELPDCSVDSVVTDPPYHLTSIVKRFGGENAAPAMSAAQRRFAKTGGADRKPGPDQYGRLTKGFMGKQWDGGDIAFRVELWAECWRVLKPGGHLIAFSGSRTYHRMVVAIEDAGFEVRDMIAWLYGSGFPKSHDISKAIDRMAGAEREIVSQGAPVKRMIPGADQHKDGWEKTNGRVYVPTETAPATEEAAQWEGWGTALKPAIEPICLARKPLSEKTVAANVLRWGVGAINEDACRVPTSDQLSGSGTPPLRYGGENSRPFHSEAIPQGCSQHPGGRHPANVVHDGSPEVVGAFPAEAGAFAPVRGTEPSNAITNVYGERVRVATTHHGDTGSAARFFYSAKADRNDRVGSKHPTVKPVDLMRWLVRLVTPPGGTVLDPFSGSGTTGEAALLEGFKAVMVEREPEYQADIARRMALVFAGETERAHAIVKARGEEESHDTLPLFGGGA